MRISTCIFALAASTMNVSAIAQTDVLRASGLLGTWSVDCANQWQPRYTFGDNKMTITFDVKGSAPQKIEIVIATATRVTEEKVSMTFDLLSGKPVVLEKVGNKFRGSWDDKLMEKCLN